MPISSIVRAKTTAGPPQIINTYVGGIFTTYSASGGSAQNFSRFVSLQPTGYVNTSFNPGGSYFSGTTGGIYTATSVNSIAVQSDGKILVGGNFTQYITNNNTYTCSNLVRLNTDGSLDAVYTGSTSGFSAPVLTVAVDYSGRTIVGGQFTTFDGSSRNYIMRFNSDTTVDTSFGDPGLDKQVNVIVPTPYHILYDDTMAYTYLVGGKFNKLMVELIYDGGIVLNYFNSFTGTSVNTIALNTDLLFENEILGNVVVYVGGDFTGYNNKPTEFNSIVSMALKDGSNYDTFKGTTDGFDRPVNSINKFIILNVDGTVNVKNFDFNGTVNTIALDCCGKFLVGGEFTTVYSGTVNYITRFLPDASNLDKTFRSLGFNNFVKTIYYSKS